MSTRGDNRRVQKPGTIFFSRTYDEVLSLIRETRDYLAGPGQAALKSLPSEVSYGYAAESLRLTTRLTECMSWLMFQRALQTGEISVEQAQEPECHLQHSDVCLPTEVVVDAQLLPAGLQSLLDRSEKLYARVARLDRQGVEAYQKRHG